MGPVGNLRLLPLLIIHNLDRICGWWLPLSTCSLVPVGKLRDPSPARARGILVQCPQKPLPPAERSPQGLEQNQAKADRQLRPVYCCYVLAFLLPYTLLTLAFLARSLGGLAGLLSSI